MAKYRKRRPPMDTYLSKVAHLTTRFSQIKCPKSVLDPRKHILDDLRDDWEYLCHGIAFSITLLYVESLKSYLLREYSKRDYKSCSKQLVITPLLGLLGSSPLSATVDVAYKPCGV
ncbi:hypothetical protein SAY86_006357 [Trapa natans]|uniref:Uncharacterized protein n=1 Tax=Trapa natans TaxID=22666 RepID=A0AAN7L763_TRANT|nr:hypothetical protein SAY86_006357 [Trapa natans]